VLGGPLLVLGLLLIVTALVGGRVTAQPRGAVPSFLLSPLDPTAWRATRAIGVGFVVELVAFALISSLFSTGVSLLVFGVGAGLIGLGVEGSRVLARIERRRAMRVDPRPLYAHPYRPHGPGLRDLVVAVFVDLNRWRDVVYAFVAFPLTALELVVAATLWMAALILLSVPLWQLTDSLPVATGTSPASGAAIAAAIAFGSVVAGLALAMAAASASRGLMALHRAVIEGLLCVSEQQRLQQRVVTLEGSRQAVLDVEASELRRIERDLHDGAQQRLVMLTIDLGLAADKIDSDPASARTLVLDAQDQARQTLAELRNLVRGIAPAILLDRGLVPALSALAGRSPISTVVLSSVPAGERLPDAVERAAYFVVAEALANVAKHARASRCEVRCRRETDRLVVEVWDDGAGGATAAPGGGLAGLSGRVEALDGQLSIDSPSGGPTLVRAEIPLPATGTAPGTIPGWHSPDAAAWPAAQEPR
jgi:signal transduction histidine kinase